MEPAFCQLFENMPAPISIIKHSGASFLPAFSTHKSPLSPSKSTMYRFSNLVDVSKSTIYQILSMPSLQNLDIFMKKTISASVGENSVIFLDLTRRSLKLIFRQKFIKVHQVLMRNATINFFHITFGVPRKTLQNKERFF